MFRTEKIQFDSKVSLNVYIWTPENCQKINGTVQLAHGMSEHLGRYSKFAEYLNNLGFIAGNGGDFFFCQHTV